MHSDCEKRQTKSWNYIGQEYCFKRKKKFTNLLKDKFIRFYNKNSKRKK